MDLTYILSVEIDSLQEEDKDELYNTLMWFDHRDSELDAKTASKLMKVYQEIMKFKGEQVEALTAELDELAIRQGEEEASKENNVKRRRTLSDSADSEDWEEKYKELKHTVKLLKKSNDEQKEQIEKLKIKNEELEKEKFQLQEELQIKYKEEESSSDTSESLKQKYSEQLKAIHTKNNQISQLLSDTKEVEAENNNLREETIKLKTELEEARNHLSSLANELSSYKLRLSEKSETLLSLQNENENTKLQLESVIEEKQQLEKETQEFVTELNLKIEKWKVIVDEKNSIINEYRSKLKSSSKYDSDDFSDKIRIQLEVLNKSIVEKDEEILELQKQLRSATEEMQETTKVLEKIVKERDSSNKTVADLSNLINDINQRHEKNFDRTVDFQKQIEFLEGLIAEKTEKLDTLFGVLNNKGQVELSSVLKENNHLNTNIKILEKQVSDYVTLTNRLQKTIDKLENENALLRDKLNLPSDEELNFNGIVLKPLKHKKEIRKLQSQVRCLEEDKLNLTFEIEKLRRTIPKLPKQINSEEALAYDPSINDQGVKIDKKISLEAKEDQENQKYKELIEENEALRQGLHDILQCVRVQTDSSAKEIKAESLERFLKALDVKHVSGWYHPAMRLQAEVHSLQGSNLELRKELRTTRQELLKLISSQERETKDTEEDLEKLEENVELYLSSKTENLLLYLSRTLNSFIKDYNKLENKNAELVKSLEKYNSELLIVDTQMEMLYKQFNSERTSWEEDRDSWTKEKEPLKEKILVLEAKLNEFSMNNTDNYDIANRNAQLAENLIKLNRKCLFLENNEAVLRKEIKSLRNELNMSEQNGQKRIKYLNAELNQLNLKLQAAHKSLDKKIDRQKYNDIQNNLDNLTLKHRNLLQSFEDIKRELDIERSSLSKMVEDLKQERKELQMKLVDSLAQLTEQELSSSNENIEELTKKLAQSEVNEIAEKQRANHMTNLYELVKEQLQKLEERLTENEKLNKQLTDKNLLLQENIKALEDKLINYVCPEELTNLQCEQKGLLNQIAKLTEEKKELIKEIQNLDEGRYNSIENEEKEMEILNLKHQILDLQSTSDEKAMIARLTSDVILARTSEIECRRKLEDTALQLREVQENYETCKTILAEQQAKVESLESNVSSKLSNLEDIIYKQRQQYLGSVPLVSDEHYVLNLKQVFNDKIDAFACLKSAQAAENECLILKKQFKEKLSLFEELDQVVMDGKHVSGKIKDWFTDRSSILAYDIKCCSQLKFTEDQLKQALERLTALEEKCLKLEEDLFLSCQRKWSSEITTEEGFENSSNNFLKEQEVEKNDIEKADVKQAITLSELVTANVILKKSIETQTVLEMGLSENGKINTDELIHDLQAKILTMGNEITQRDQTIKGLRSKITELEMTLSMFRTQIADKQSQIKFYEKHIIDLQNKLSSVTVEVQTSGPLNEKCVQENIVLQKQVEDLQESLRQKESSLNELQLLLKSDRDEHSLAASRMQQELQKLQDIIDDQRRTFNEFKERALPIQDKEEIATFSPPAVRHPGRHVIDHYISQVHQLESHTSELHTNLSMLASQLKASRLEAVRWQTLADERLQAIGKIQKDIEEQHQNEIVSYKKENERWKQEVSDLQQVINKYKAEPKLDVTGKLKEKDDKIYELTVAIGNLKNELKKAVDHVCTSKVTELEAKNQQLIKELETSKKHLEQIINREKAAREEIRNLKDQLMKKPVSVRSDRSEKEQQLEKKVNQLENQIKSLEEKLREQMLQSETHRLRVAEDFDKWNKQKQWQQRAEKLKNKLKEKSNETEKLHQTCSSYRMLIEKLEKEKRALENRIKILQNGGYIREYLKNETQLRQENSKLKADLENLKAKFQIQQHHSGALGATMMQEKLEAQERKIAAMELSSKGTAEVREEFERLQNCIANLQKTNYRLEAENLEMKLDLEKHEKNVPRLQEQLQYLENYVQVLKEENAKHTVSASGDDGQERTSAKRMSELERTVFILKRVVEKLQRENRCLLNKAKTCSSRDLSTCPDKLLQNFLQVKEQYGQSIQEIVLLKEHLKAAENKIKHLESRESSLSEELSLVKSQKSLLLDKIKILLRHSASKQKLFIETPEPKPSSSANNLMLSEDENGGE